MGEASQLCQVFAVVEAPPIENAKDELLQQLKQERGRIAEELLTSHRDVHSYYQVLEVLEQEFDLPIYRPFHGKDPYANPAFKGDEQIADFNSKYPPSRIFQVLIGTLRQHTSSTKEALQTLVHNQIIKSKSFS